MWGSGGGGGVGAGNLEFCGPLRNQHEINRYLSICELFICLLFDSFIYEIHNKQFYFLL
jgi:hypothetical protein